jgi:GC-rich sequence DNA-binding factor
MASTCLVCLSLAFFFSTDAYLVAADNDSAIPFESSKLNAKQKRKRTTVPSNEDYISLSVIKWSEESEGPHPESRLMRKEDGLGSGDDGMYLFIC